MSEPVFLYGPHGPIRPETLKKIFERCSEVGICTECGGNILHDIDAPFASCDGCSFYGEWHHIPTLEKLRMEKAQYLSDREEMRQRAQVIAHASGEIKCVNCAELHKWFLMYPSKKDLRENVCQKCHDGGH